MTAAQRREMFLKATKEEKPDFRVLTTDDKEELVPYGLLTLDYVLGLRGIGRRGRVTQIHGNEGAGKSTLTYQIAANYQKFTGEPLADYDFERTGTVPFISRVGVDPSLCHFEQPDSVEKCIQDVVKRMRMGIRQFIFDSIPRMKTKVSFDAIKSGEAFKQFGANHARTMAMFYDILLPWAAEYDCNFMMVNQTRDRIDDGPDAAQAQKYPTFTNLPYSLPGGRACRFVPSVMIELKLLKALQPYNPSKEGADPWLVEPMTDATEGKFVVNMVRARTLKDKVNGAGYREGVIFVRPGQGIDENMAVRHYAREYSLINWVGKKWVVGDDAKTIATYDNKDAAIAGLVGPKPDQAVLDELKKYVIKKIEEDGAARFGGVAEAGLSTYLEGVEAVEPGDEVELPKGKIFQIED